MSYCRWSSNDWTCDVYVYESDVGWVTHVASSRRHFKEPLPPRVSFSDPDAWIARHKAVSRMINAASLVSIGLPHDGESFLDGTPAQCADRLERLRAMGYNVPEYAINTLREESEAA